MANMELLRDKINSTGIPLTFIAKGCAMTRHALYNKLAGKSEFKASEIFYLTKILHLTHAERDQIFFGE